MFMQVCSLVGSFVWAYTTEYVRYSDRISRVDGWVVSGLELGSG